MAKPVKPEIGEVGLKQRDRVSNWSKYERALVDRGNVTIWFDDASVKDQSTPPPPDGGGQARRVYPETAIQTWPTIRTRLRLPRRATPGLVTALMWSCLLHLPVPNHNCVSRRATQIAVSARLPRSRTGVASYASLEQAARQHDRERWRRATPHNRSPIAAVRRNPQYDEVVCATTASVESRRLPA